MKKHTRTIALIAFLAGVVTIGIPIAGAATGKLQADIPFDFVVRGRTLPGGTYDVEIDPSGLLRVHAADHRSSAAVFTVGIGGNASLNDGQLVFHASGGVRVLTEVWRPGQGNGRAVLPRFKVRAFDEFERTAISLRVEPGDRSG